MHRKRAGGGGGAQVKWNIAYNFVSVYVNNLFISWEELGVCMLTHIRLQVSMLDFTLRETEGTSSRKDDITQTRCL